MRLWWNYEEDRRHMDVPKMWSDKEEVSGDFFATIVCHQEAQDVEPTHKGPKAHLEYNYGLYNQVIKR